MKRSGVRRVPSRADLAFLHSRSVEMLCFASYSLYLHLGEGVVVTIEGEFEHTVAGERPHRYSFPLQNSKLMRLIAQTIDDLAVLDDGTLRFEFSNGDRLIVRGKNGPYEAYHIKRAGAEITV
jgi:hypothetical protein